MLRSISGPGSNDEQPPDSAGRLPGVLIATGTHFDIKKEKEATPFSQSAVLRRTELALSPAFVFLSPIAFISLSFTVHVRGLKQDLTPPHCLTNEGSHTRF